MTHLLALTLGDRYGIGPEIVARTIAAWTLNDDLTPVVVGDKDVFDQGCAIAGVAPRLPRIASLQAARDAGPAPVFVHRPCSAPLGPLGRVSAEAGREVLDTLAEVAQAVRHGFVDGMVYAPLSKQAMLAAGHAGAVETDLFARVFGGEAAEINVVDGLATSRVTSHVPVSAVASLVTHDSVAEAVRRMWSFLRMVGVERPRLAVAGLNPHAGEGGAFGREEIEVIAPAIAAVRRDGILASGPFAPDTVFPQAIAGHFDAVVTMYHDQGQIALKLIGLGRGVTFIEGLGVPVATPGHGTAFDIAGKGLAKADGLRRALRLCRSMLSGAPAARQAPLEAMPG